jgi:hypothetical protein
VIGSCETPCLANASVPREGGALSAVGANEHGTGLDLARRRPYRAEPGAESRSVVGGSSCSHDLSLFGDGEGGDDGAEGEGAFDGGGGEGALGGEVAHHAAGEAVAGAGGVDDFFGGEGGEDECVAVAAPGGSRARLF